MINNSYCIIPDHLYPLTFLVFSRGCQLLLYPAFIFQKATRGIAGRHTEEPSLVASVLHHAALLNHYWYAIHRSCKKRCSMPCPSMWPKQFWSVQNGFGLTKLIWSRPKWIGQVQIVIFYQYESQFGPDQFILVITISLWLCDQLWLWPNHYGQVQINLVRPKPFWTDQNCFCHIEGQGTIFHSLHLPVTKTHIHNKFLCQHFCSCHNAKRETSTTSEVMPMLSRKAFATNSLK